MSSAYHPQTDGQTERVNRVLQDTLRHYISPSQDDWDTHLPLIEFAINSSKHASTGETPFFLNYGRHPRTPLDLQLPDVSGPDHTNTPGVLKYVHHMQTALNKAKKCLIAARQRQKAYADTKRSEHTIKLHDDVLLSTTNIHLKCPGTRKLLPKWIGPFTVIQKVNPVAFKLALPVTMASVHPVFHVSMLKPYQASGSVQPPPPIIDDEGDLVYFVESILDHRLKKHGRKSMTEFLVKWKGYDHEHNSWEPETNIMDPELIDLYWKRRKLADTQVTRRQSRKRNFPSSNTSAPKRHNTR